MEAIRNYEKRRKNLIFFMIISNIFYLGSGYFLFKRGVFDNIWILFGWIGGFIILWIIIEVKKTKFINSCKNELIKPEIEKMGLEYEPEMIVDLKYVDESGLIDKEYDDYEGGDFVRGDNFIFSYLHLTKEEYTTTNDEGETETETEIVTVFDGIFFVGVFPKKVDGFYIVKKNTIHLSDILPIFVEKNRIKLDMPEFEKIFDVYGTDQVEGRYIFDFTFMQNLLKVYDLVQFEKFSVKNGKYFITFPGIKFKSSLFKDMRECIKYNIGLVYILSNIDKILFKERG